MKKIKNLFLLTALLLGFVAQAGVSQGASGGGHINASSPTMSENYESSAFFAANLETPVIIFSAGRTTVSPGSNLMAYLSNYPQPYQTGFAVAWHSDNTSVATISPDGVITGVATGTANITCEIQDLAGATATSVPTPVIVSFNEDYTGVATYRYCLSTPGCPRYTATVPPADITALASQDEGYFWIEPATAGMVSANTNNINYATGSVGVNICWDALPAGGTGVVFVGNEAQGIRIPIAVVTISDKPVITDIVAEIDVPCWQYEITYLPVIDYKNSAVTSEGWVMANGSSIVFPLANGAQIKYVIESECGTVESTPVTVNITDSPVVGDLTNPGTICIGAKLGAVMTTPTVTFSGTYTGTWVLGGSVVNSDYAFAIGDNGKELYYEITTERCGKATSSTVTLDVKTLPTVTNNIPATIVCWDPSTFTVSTVANCQAGTLVKARVTIANPADADKVLVEYYETYPGMEGWYELTFTNGVASFGPASGFPMSDATSTFRVSNKNQTTASVDLDITVEIVDATATTTVFASGTATTTVTGKPSIAITATPGTILCQGDASNAINLAFTGKPNYTLVYAVNGTASTFITSTSTATIDLSGYAVGSYTVSFTSLTDGNGCTPLTMPADITFEILPQPTVTITNLPATVACNPEWIEFGVTMDANCQNIEDGALYISFNQSIAQLQLFEGGAWKHIPINGTTEFFTSNPFSIPAKTSGSFSFRIRNTNSTTDDTEYAIVAKALGTADNLSSVIAESDTAKTVILGVPAVASLTASPEIICLGGDLAVTINTINNADSLTYALLHNGNAIELKGVTIAAPATSYTRTYTPSAAGTYTLNVLDISNRSTGCTAPSTATVTAVVTPLPEIESIDLSADVMCVNDTLEIEIATLNGGNSIDYTVYHDGSVFESATLTAPAGAVSPYKLKYAIKETGEWYVAITKVTNTTASCVNNLTSAFVSDTVTVAPQPEVTITGLPDTIACPANPYEYAVTTVANCKEGTNVLGKVTIAPAADLSNVIIEYYESDSWKGLNSYFDGNGVCFYGPVGGFPLADATSRFRISNNNQTTASVDLDITVEIVDATATTTVFASGTATTTVTGKPSIAITATPGTILCQGDASNAIKLAFTGKPNYTLVYAVNGTASTFITSTSTATIDLSGYAVGSYTVSFTSLTDGNGCTPLTMPADITFEILPQPTVTITNLPATVACNPEWIEFGVTMDANCQNIEDGALYISFNQSIAQLQLFEGGAWKPIPINGTTDFFTSSTFSIPAKTSGSFSFRIKNTNSTTDDTEYAIVAKALGTADSLSSVIAESDTAKTVILGVPAVASLTASPEIICLGDDLAVTINTINNADSLSYALLHNGNVIELKGVTIAAPATSYTRTYTPSAAGTYTLIVMDISNRSTGCTALSPAMVTAVVNPLPTVTAFSISQDSICVGSMATVAITTDNGGDEVEYALYHDNVLLETATVTGTSPFTKDYPVTETGWWRLEILSVTNSATSCTTKYTDQKDSVLVKPLPTVTNNLVAHDTIDCNGPYEYTVVTEANCLTGTNTLVKGKVTVTPPADADKVFVEYYETGGSQAGNWLPLFAPGSNTVNFGPTTGFPYMDAASSFRITNTNTTTNNVTLTTLVEMVDAATGNIVYASDTVETVILGVPAIESIELSAPTLCLNQYVEATVTTINGADALHYTLTKNGVQYQEGYLTAAAGQESPFTIKSKISSAGTYTFIIDSLYSTTTGCFSTPDSTGTVIVYDVEAPKVLVNDQTLCSGSTLDLNISAVGAANWYSWKQVAGDNIGFTSGEGKAFPPYVITNMEVTRTATIRVTSYYAEFDSNGNVSQIVCVGDSTDATIKIYGIPTADIPVGLVYCHGQPVEEYFFSGPMDSEGTVEYHWHYVLGHHFGLSETSGVNSIPAFTALNVGVTPIMGVYEVTAYFTDANGMQCQGQSLQFLITVNPTPTLTKVEDQVYCHNTDVASYQFASNREEAVFSWHLLDGDTGLPGLPIKGNNDFPAFKALNETGAPITANYVVQVRYEYANTTCGTSSDTFAITVNPRMELPEVNNLTVCNGESVDLSSLLPAASGYEYRWVQTGFNIGLSPMSGKNMIPSFNAVNGTDNPITGTFAIRAWSLDSLCHSDEIRFDVTVKPAPIVNTIADKYYYNGDQVSQFGFTGTATSFKWIASNTAIGIQPEGMNVVPEFTATNVTSGVISSLIKVVPMNGTCEGDTTEVTTIYVNPRTIEDPDLLVESIEPQTVCIGADITPVTYSATHRMGADLTGITFETRLLPGEDVLLLGASSTATGFGPSTYVNTTNAPVTGTYEVTPILNNNRGRATVFTVTVQPTPVVNPLANILVANGELVPATVFSGIATQYSWVADNTATGVAASGFNQVPSFTAKNTTSAPIVSTIEVTPVYGACTGTAGTFTITVDPKVIPDVDNLYMTAINDQTVCSNAEIAAITFAAKHRTISTLTGVTYEVSYTGTDVLGNATLGATGYSASSYVNTTNAPVSGHYKVTPYWNNFRGESEEFTITVNPVPTVEALPQGVVVKNGDVTPEIPFIGVGDKFAWTADNTSIGIAASGTGNILPFQAINTTDQPIVVTIKAVPYYGECVGEETAVTTITVNPWTISDETNFRMLPINSQTVCSAAPTTEITFAATHDRYADLTGIKYEVELVAGTDVLAGFEKADGTGYNAAIYTNTTIAPIAGQYRVTPVWNNYRGKAVEFTITVKPAASVNMMADKTVYNGEFVNVITFTGKPTGADFAWVADKNLGNAMSGTNYIPAFTARTSSSVTETVSFTVTPSFDGCTSGSVVALKINVIPKRLDDKTIKMKGIADQTLCAGATLTDIPLEATHPYPAAVGFNNADVTFEWTKVGEEIFTPAKGATGTILPSANPVFAGGVMVSPDKLVRATYRVTPVWNNYEGVPAEFTITVLPKPTMSQPKNQVLCNGSMSEEVVFSSNIQTSTEFSWNVVDASGNPIPSKIGLHQVPSTGNIKPFAVTNTTTDQVKDIIKVTPRYIVNSDNGACEGTSATFTIAVNPTPAVDAITNIIVTPGTIVPAYPITGTTNAAYTTYKWTNNNMATGLNTTEGMNTVPSFTAKNSTQTNQVSVITVTPFYTRDGITCEGTPISYTITVLPIPDIEPVDNMTVCAGENVMIPLGAETDNNAYFTWTSSNPATGLSDNATGAKYIAFIAANNTSGPISTIVTVIPHVESNGTISDGTPFSFTITVNPITVITTQPIEPAPVCEGETINLTVTASGADLKYQWFKDGAPLTTADNSTALSQTLVLANVKAADAGIYYVQVTGACGMDESDPVQVQVNLSNIVNQRWNDVLVVNCNVEKNGGYNFKAFQWYKNGQLLVGEISATYQETNAVNTNDVYTVRLTTVEGKVFYTCGTHFISTVEPIMISVYPNPVNAGDVVTAEIKNLPSADMSTLTYKVMNASNGATISFTKGSAVTSITMPTTAGIYVLRADYASGYKVFKIIVK